MGRFESLSLSPTRKLLLYHNRLARFPDQIVCSGDVSESWLIIRLDQEIPRNLPELSSAKKNQSGPLSFST